jgi:ATP-binding cassette subfamily B multidrug efflux pump
MRSILKYIKPYTLSIIGLLILTYGQTATTLALPDYMATIINKGIVAGDTHVIYSTGLQMLLVALLGGVLTVGVGFLGVRIATGFSKRLREAVFVKTENFSLVEFNTFSTSSLITRCTNDIQQVQLVAIILLRMGLMAPFLGVGAVIKAYGLAPSMTWIMATAVVTIVVIIGAIFSLALPRFKRLQELVDRLNLVSREILTGLRVVRAFNRQDQEEAKFDDTNRELTRVNLAVNRLMVILQPSIMLIMNLASIAIVWVGAYGINSGAIGIGGLFAFMQYAIQAITGFLLLSIVFILVPRASVSINRIAEVLNAEPIIIDPEKPTKIPASNKRGRVEFRQVSFSYAGAEAAVLSDISFTAEPGQTTAIVGSTGSGKSTLINLIPRFYDTSHGQVLIDDVDVRELRLDDVYSKIGYVPQKAMLFSGTVKNTIAYGAPHSDDIAIQHAARIAQAEEFVTELDGGYDAHISQGGNNVSGGQKQRLSIARALARNPEIYIFDDSFSALDFKTDAQLRAALLPETKGKTILIVAQRISTILNADKIIVLDEGRIVGQGTHRELMKSSKVYQEIASSQLSDKELTRTLRPSHAPALGGQS